MSRLSEMLRELDEIVSGPVVEDGAGKDDDPIMVTIRAVASLHAVSRSSGNGMFVTVETVLPEPSWLDGLASGAVDAWWSVIHGELMEGRIGQWGSPVDVVFGLWLSAVRSVTGLVPSLETHSEMVRGYDAWVGIALSEAVQSIAQHGADLTGDDFAWTNRLLGDRGEDTEGSVLQAVEDDGESVERTGTLVDQGVGGEAEPDDTV